MTITSTAYIAYYNSPGGRGLHDCATEKEAIDLLLEREKSKNITPVAVIESSTRQIVWFNKELGLKACKAFIDEFEG